jgi:AraC family transcriptional regulator, regulatory protein of adaptative response / DNA-3-methyladenine glycosylase II
VRPGGGGIRRVPVNDWVAAFLADRCVAGIEELVDGEYRRAVRLEQGGGVIVMTRDQTIWTGDPRDGPAAGDVARRIDDADADTDAIDPLLARDPALRPLVRARPGLRVPGAVGGFEIAVRAVIGQQVSVTAARTIAGRLAAELGEPLDGPVGGVVRCFPTPAALAATDPASLPMPRARGTALVGLARAVADGLPETPDAFGTLPGIGPWTVAYVAMRLGDRDAFPGTDLGVLRAAARLGLPEGPRALERHAEGWRPYRAYAVQHLWATLRFGEP